MGLSSIPGIYLAFRVLIHVSGHYTFEFPCPDLYSQTQKVIHLQVVNCSQELHYHAQRKGQSSRNEIGGLVTHNSINIKNFWLLNPVKCQVGCFWDGNQEWQSTKQLKIFKDPSERNINKATNERKREAFTYIGWLVQAMEMKAQDYQETKTV